MNYKRVGDSLKISGDFSEFAITDMVSDYVKQIEAKCDDLSGILNDAHKRVIQLEAESLWKTQMLERAKRVITFQCTNSNEDTESGPDWLSDLEVGPK